MKSTRNYPIYKVNKHAEGLLVGGHPWVYENDILEAPETTPENGTLADVVSPKGAYLGTGFLSLQSKIRVRLISRNANDTFDADFWRRRVEYAWNYRKTVLEPDDLSACRVIFGEADQFPGLTVDRFQNILVTQTLSVGMEKLKPLLFPLLAEVLRADGQTIDGIYERNDEALRAKEGLEQISMVIPPLVVKGLWDAIKSTTKATNIARLAAAVEKRCKGYAASEDNIGLTSVCRVVINLSKCLITHFGSLAAISGSPALVAVQAALGSLYATLLPFSNSISIYLQTSVLKVMIWLVNPPTDEASTQRYLELVQRTKAMKLPVSIAQEVLTQLVGRALSTPTLSHFAVEVAWTWFLQNPETVTVDTLLSAWHACFSLHDIVNCEYTLNVGVVGVGEG